jgi:glucose/arabinose dehydrogenase
MARYFRLGLAVLVIAGFVIALRSTQALPLENIKLPDGFEIGVYATGVRSARQMALGANGTVFAGSMNAGTVYAVVDSNKDHRADDVIELARGLDTPSGIAFHDGALYVAEVSRITRYDDIESRLKNPPQPAVVNDQLPHETHHGWKFIAFGPDGMLYVPVGAPCNVCRVDARHGVINRMNAGGSGLEVFALGVRNSVGFDWHPVTKELWFTENGRDSMGDNIPPDELNHAPTQGLHFGFPGCHAGSIADPEFGTGPCSQFTPPVMSLTPHGAAIGMRFYTGTMFPPEFQNQIFIAEHGSWNRSTPIGYRVMLARLDGNKVVKYEPFAEGWLQGSRAWGRPSDVLVMPDGALLVADDDADVIYRISYRKGSL